MKRILLILLILTLISSCKISYFPKSEYERFIIIDDDNTNGFSIYQIVKVHSDGIRRISIDRDCLYKVGDTLTIEQINNLNH